MTEQMTLDKIEKNLDFFHKMYDIVRIVDPLLKQVIEYRENKTYKTDEVCFDYWQNGKICDNCISVRAYHENKSFMKLEQGSGTIMMVTAIPIERDTTPLILELLKNATDSMLIGSGDYNDGHLMRNVVEEINNIAVKDQLTSLFNRRFIDDRLPVEIVNATIEDLPLSTIFIDVDNLKCINDTFGHSAGDLALKEVAGSIQRSIRSDNDWAARYGGDEFLICLNKTDYLEAYQIAENIRCNAEKILISLPNGSANLTISLGIHTMQNSKLTAEEIISLADKKMYEAKKSGKNITASSIEITNDC